LPGPGTLIDMANQRDNADEPQARLELMIEEFRTAEKRALLKRGITLWTRTEAQHRIAQFDAPFPQGKIN
jgi:hypothetical protein